MPAMPSPEDAAEAETTADPAEETVVSSGLTAERLREVLHYHAETGLFLWRVDRTTKTRAGQVAGTATIDGYRQICVDGRQYRAHRLAWLWITGQWPPDEIDHKNGSRSDNRWDNLREASGMQNKQNRSRNKNTITGFKGVAFDRRRNKWLAQIRVDGKLISLGRFRSPEEASAVYLAAAIQYFGEFARAS